MQAHSPRYLSFCGAVATLVLSLSTPGVAQTAPLSVSWDRCSHVVIPQRDAFSLNPAHRRLAISSVRAQVKILEQTEEFMPMRTAG